MLKVIYAVLISVLCASFAYANDSQPSQNDRASTGGAQTLDDILARQKGLEINDGFRRSNDGSQAIGAELFNQLGTLGGASDPELWRALRFGSANVSVSSNGPAASIIMQDSGMRWLEFRKGPLARTGGYALIFVLLFLALFYVARGKIRIDGEKTGRTVTRFKAVERFGHWLMAGSFVLLGVTGIITLFGRMALIPLIGHDAFSPLALASKWVHNNVSWAFMIGLVMVFVMWVLENIPNRHDLVWIAKGGGIFKAGVHPPAKKFNAGQKLIFWSVIVLGASISVSGLSLLFPFEMPLFAASFAHLNDLGIPNMIGMSDLPVQLTPHQEMQLAQLWHTIVAFVLIAIILAHIYIGSVGMEGAFDAMGSGEVEEQWAREHHALWLDEIDAKKKQPAE
ncbi:MAG: formate dehydrogenase subunit gamma [Paracoccaceae bacterium]